MMFLRRGFTQHLVRSTVRLQRYQTHSLPISTIITRRGFSATNIIKDRLTDAEQQMNLGTEQLNQGSLDMAMNHYHRSVQLVPTPAGFFNIGVCYFQMGKHKDAIQSFEKALQLDPNAADAHTNIASCYLMLSDVQPAIVHLEKASNFNPLDGEIHYNLGCVYEATGKLDDARTRFERARDLGISQATAALDKLNKKMGN
ncbi:uncharacterized protein BX664DRAFT_271986 [Halteromyces radiatus]|uniref:uncharacterized protein n=1 Tax=Halteromyces radiatus TaxID=101107 RepID=UPI002220B2E5|nr:uncharacterized protein BX664DRAFT_271986 [Halteromyces radiatus]KAI8099003.1 hypothetical protein BX664DRAFT_271986 [Halteromyces radiatus]